MRPTILLFVSTAVLAAVSHDICWSDTMKLIPSDPLTKVLPTVRPEPPYGGGLGLDGAFGETISAQAVLIPGDAADTVTARVSALRHADGSSTIPPGATRLQWVRYMEITANTPAIPRDELVAVAPASIPDPFWEQAERAVSPGIPQPLWIELEVPEDASPGEYTGELTVTGRSGRCSLPLSLRVRNFRMPQERHQRVIQWWDVPGTAFAHIKPGTDAYWKHLEGMCALVRRHRQTDVRMGWDLIERKKREDGGEYWDTSLFERFADTAFKTGLQAVHFTQVGRRTKSQLEPDSRIEPIEDNIGRLAAVQEVVKRRGWHGRVLASLADEPFIHEEQSFRRLLEKARQTAPDVKVIEAIETEDLGDLDIHVPKLSHLNLWWPRFEELKRRGEEIWFYTCCHPQGRYPNRFLDQPLIKARELHWIGYLYGLDGYLHWGLNWFAPDLDPYTEKGATQWNLPPGDSQVAYPGTKGYVGSMRLSAMRDGLQDYEYLWTLESRLRELKSRIGEHADWLDPRQRPLELCRRVVQSFYDHTRDPRVLLETRAAIADEIEALDASPMLYVQTSPPEGTTTPAGPIHINIRGITTPGAEVTINGKPLLPENMTATGCFAGFVFIEKATPEITIAARLGGAERIARRRFNVVE